MALYLGKNLVSASSGSGGDTIKNQDKTITENGKYSHDEGFTGLGEVTVSVLPNNQHKTFTENGSYAADSGYTGLGVVKVDVQPKNQDKNITANGTYRADSGYTGLGEVVVEVPPTPPNNQDITVKENGTYTAENGYTGLGTVTVDVGSAVSVSPKDVNFYDYDGTILHSYTVEEAQALTELPELPTQKGLICQGWNYDLETIKACNCAVNVGAMYITDDGKTRLYIRIASEGRMSVPLYFSQTVANGVTIDWGDGSPTETLSYRGNASTTHTYASSGDYVISLDVTEGCTLGLGTISAAQCIIGRYNFEGMSSKLKKVEIGKGVLVCTKYAFYGCYSLASVTIPNSVTSINSEAFYYCYSLTHITIPNSVTTVEDSVFWDCRSLRSVSIPNSVTLLKNNAFKQCYSLASVTIPNSVTSLSNSTFYYCYSLTHITIPNSVTEVTYNVFSSCSGLAFIDFSTHNIVPSLLATTCFQGIASDCQIRVPAALYDEWIAATNWSNYASKIVAV